MLRSLTFLVTLTHFPEDVEKFAIRAELVGTNGEVKPFSKPQDIPNAGPGRSMNIIFQSAPIAFTGPGMRAFRLHINEDFMDLPYEFRVENIPDTPKASAPNKTPSVKRRAKPAKTGS